MELLKIFDEHQNEIGVASRDEAHEKGLWHEVFQYWHNNRLKKILSFSVDKKV